MPDAESNSASPGFWSRQFGPAVTDTQLGSDVIFGLILPPICLYFDPVVFRRGDFPISATLQGVAVIAYVASAICSAALIALIAFGNDARTSRRSFLAGVLFVGAFFGVLVGFAILPMSTIGVIFCGIGLLGFTPFVTALVYARNAVRAARGGRTAWLLAGALFSFAAPTLAQLHVTRSIAGALVDAGSIDPTRVASATAILHRYHPFIVADDLHVAWVRHADPAAKARFEATYLAATGRSVQSEWSDWD